MKFLIFIILVLSFTCFAQKSKKINGYIITENAALRDTPEQSGEIVAIIPMGTKITLNFAKPLIAGWYSVTYKNKKGYLHGNTFSFKPDFEPKYALNKEDLLDAEKLKQAKLGYSYITSGKLTHWFYMRSSRKSSFLGVSYWLKQVPIDATAFSKQLKVKTKVDYFLQYATADCERERLSLEQSTFYNTKGEAMNVPRFYFDDYGSQVIPNSLGEYVLNILCR